VKRREFIALLGGAGAASGVLLVRTDAVIEC